MSGLLRILSDVTAITPPSAGSAPATADDARTAARWASVLDLARGRSAELGVEDLAEQAGYSPFHFSRLFTTRYRVSPGRYLTALRIDAAKRMLLADETLPVVDVATEVGFDSLSSFSRRFRAGVGLPPASLRRLADQVAGRPVRPFTITGDGAGAIAVGLDLPAGFSPRGDPSVWVGWYPHPAPIGLPRAGMLLRGRLDARLPLCPGAPFLLGFAVPAHASVEEQLVPAAPVVAVHPAPLLAAGAVTLRFGAQDGSSPVPLLSALPSLRRP